MPQDAEKPQDPIDADQTTNEYGDDETRESEGEGENDPQTLKSPPAGTFIPFEIIQKIITGDQSLAPVKIAEFDFIPDRDTETRPTDETSLNADTESGTEEGYEETPPSSRQESSIPLDMPRNTNRPPDKEDLRSLASYLKNNRNRQ
jgi:hypothetical protein